MKLPSKSAKTEKWLSALAVLVMACFFAVFAVINFKCFARFCEQDMYADTLVARMMWEQKSLFPLGYVFGNQLYVVATPVLAALFYGLTGSPNTAMALATTVMSVLILLSFDWLLRPFVKRRLSLCCAMLMLVACAFGEKLVNQEMGQLLFILCSYYACYLITLFVVLGDYVRSMTEPRLRPIPLVLSLLLCFATGMQSLRQTCIMVLPILAFEALRLLLGFRKQGREILRRRQMPLTRALAYAAANLAGWLFVKLFPVHQYTIFNSAPDSFSQRMTDIYVAFRDVAGFGWAGPEHPFFILLLAFQLALLFGALVLQLRGLRRGGTLSDLWWLLLISIAAVTAAALVTSLQIRAVYLFTYYPLLALSTALVLEQGKPRLRCAVALALCLLSLVNLYTSYIPSVRSALAPQEEPLEQISAWAVENGYELVYGNHSTAAPGIAAYSDGDLVAGCWDEEVMFKVKPYLNIQNIYSIEDASRAIFVFTPQELEYAYEAASYTNDSLHFQGQFGQFYVYTCGDQLMYPRTYLWFEKQWNMGLYSGGETEDTEE
ncbi:MAG: hypothetical protein ACI4O0_05350 [Candidatus Limivicinus sp.]